MADEKEGFADLLKGMGNGFFHGDVTEAVQRVVKSLMETSMSAGGKQKGELNIKIKFVFDRGAINIDPSFTTKLPSPVHPLVMMYPGRDGSLHKQNQEQLGLPMGEVRPQPEQNREVRNVAEQPRDSKVVDFRARAANDNSAEAGQ